MKYKKGIEKQKNALKILSMFINTKITEVMFKIYVTGMKNTEMMFKEYVTCIKIMEVMY